jgi:hypothetical protein
MTGSGASLLRHADEGQHPFAQPSTECEWTLKQVQGDETLVAVEAQKLLGISLEGSVG